MKSSYMSEADQKGEIGFANLVLNLAQILYFHTGLIR